MLASKVYNNELTYLFNQAYYVSASYKFIKDGFGQLPLQGVRKNQNTGEETRFLRYIRSNYGDQSEAGLAIGMNKTWLQGRWNTNYMVAAQYNKFMGVVKSDPINMPEAGIEEILTPFVVDAKNFNTYFQINNTIFLSAKKDWIATVNYWYLSPKQIELGKLSTLQSLDVSLKKIINNWTVILEVYDVMGKNVDVITNNQPDGSFNNIFSNEYNRQFNVKLTYNFGNQKLKKAREIDAVNSAIKDRI